MVTPLTGTARTVFVDPSSESSGGHASARKRTRYRRRLRPIAFSNQTRAANRAVVSCGKSFAHQGKVAFSHSMADFDREPQGIWDEYDWERFLQQQDQRTEKYMELLEKYIDDPHRDEIIAREMGWTQSTADGDWSAEVDALLDEDWRSESD